jgi:ferrous iron transport protein B
VTPPPTGAVSNGEAPVNRSDEPVAAHAGDPRRASKLAGANNAAREGYASAQTTPHVLLFGNPNVGKTTLFNALTGEAARVGNYAGITVERRSAPLRGSTRPIELVDAPGAYSLSARSLEEQVAISAALGQDGNPTPSLIVVVLDAGQLTRNLYLALQLAEFRLPLLFALTMMDEVLERPPVPERVGALFGVPCVPVNARSGSGVAELARAIEQGLLHPRPADVELTYPTLVQQLRDHVAESLPAQWRRNVEHDRALALWALLSLSDSDELEVDEKLRNSCAQQVAYAGEHDLDLDLSIVRTRYQFIEQRIDECYSGAAPQSKPVEWTERMDRVLLHPAYGFAFFCAVMLALFQSLFSWADPAIGLIEDGIGLLQQSARSSLGDGVLVDLLVEGVLGGVGNVIVFVPQIVLLFLLVGVLEDSGYMARVAYLMDRVMRGSGLHGKAFVPMLSGLACAVPAILSTRTMERQRDRILTMMVVPLMTCSARLPVYALMIGALFPPSQVFGFMPVQGLLLVLMYLFSTLTTLAAAWVLGRTVVRGQRVPLLLELPRYRWPSLRTTARMIVQRTREFLVQAGTVILAMTVGLWFLLSFPKQESPTEMAAAQSTRVPSGAEAPAVDTEVPEPPVSAIENSYGGRLGRTLEPLMSPLGFDWKLTIGVIGAFSAREVFVSTLGLVFGLEQTDDEALPLRDRMRAETRADGAPAYPPLVGLSVMVFFALACQCMSTLSVVYRETRSWRWPALMLGYMTVLAYGASFIVYQGGMLLGFAG